MWIEKICTYTFKNKCTEYLEGKQIALLEQLPTPALPGSGSLGIISAKKAPRTRLKIFYRATNIKLVCYFQCKYRWIFRDSVN